MILNFEGEAEDVDVDEIIRGILDKVKADHVTN
jgi:hypothetical protein